MVLVGAMLTALGSGCASGSAEEATTVADAAVPRWQRLPAPQEVPENSTFLAAGDLLLLYGGCAHDYSDDGRCGKSTDGLAYDPELEGWEPIPASPFGVKGPATWTGEEAIFLDLSSHRRARGLAYDPEAQAWRELPPGPVRTANGEAVWSGSEVIVWGGQTRNGTGHVQGAAYDPAADSWRRIAKAPISLNLFFANWTGSEMVVFGSQLDRRNGADARVATGAAYDPETDSWRRIPDSKLSPQAIAASWLNDRLVAYDYLGAYQLFDPATNRWSRPGKMPFGPSECYPDSAATESEVVAFYCGQIATFAPGDGRWRSIDGGLTARLHDEIPVWRFSQLASLGETAYFLTEGITFGHGGGAQYNFPDAPHSFWSYG